MSNAYRSSLASGGSAPIGDATAADVLTGKTFSGAAGSGVTGTMPNRGAVSGVATPSQPYTIPSGYHNGSGIVTGSGGTADTSFTPAGQNLATAGTNFTVGKYYILLGIDSGTDATLTGANLISKVRNDAYSTKFLTMLVRATASTITYGQNGSNFCSAMPCEITL